MTRESFLGRWSRRKLDDEEARAAEEALPDDPSSEPEPAEAEFAKPEAAESAEPHPTELIDIETLDYSSDFTQFMAKGVPVAVKRRALRKLWTSNPVLANLDGLNDYEDIVKTFGIKEIGNTAWKVGRGFLTDEDLGLTKSKDEVEAAAEETAEAGDPPEISEATPEAIDDKTKTAEKVAPDTDKSVQRVSLRRGHDDVNGTEEM